MSPSAAAFCRFSLPKSTNSETTAAWRVTRHGRANRPAVRAARIATCALPVKTRSTPRLRRPTPPAQRVTQSLSGRVNAVLALRPSPRWQNAIRRVWQKSAEDHAVERNKCLWENRFNEFRARRMRPRWRAHSRVIFDSHRWKRSSLPPNRLPKNENALGRCMRTGACRVAWWRSIAISAKRRSSPRSCASTRASRP